MRLLLSRSADVDASAGKRGGATALRAAEIKGNIKMAHILLDAGAKVNAPTVCYSGRVALDTRISDDLVKAVLTRLRIERKLVMHHITMNSTRSCCAVSLT